MAARGNSKWWIRSKRKNLPILKEWFASSQARGERMKDEELKKEDVQNVKEEEEADDGPPPGWKTIPPPDQMPPPHPPPSSSEMGQMVCGSCRHLLKYPKGNRNVQCSSCSTVNFVLEAHEIGQVKCGACSVLLMYPYGASSIKCSSCRFITEIGVSNRCPPLSVQLGQPSPLLKTSR